MIYDLRFTNWKSARSVRLFAILCTLSSLLFPGPASAQTNWVLTWQLSPDDTNGVGQYELNALPASAPNVAAQIAITNAPAGQTNLQFSPAWLPSNPCFLFVTFGGQGNGAGTSVPSCPLYFDTNAAAYAVPTPRPPARPPVVIRR